MLLTISYKPIKGGAKMPIPDLFKCPISLDLFTDPVTLCTGHTYDRPCIEKWLSSGNLTCPVTMLTLHDLSMVPNITLSHLISQWLHQTAKNTSPPSADHRLAALKLTLQSQEPTWEKKIQALKQLKILSLELPSSENEGLIRFGFLELLLELALAFHQRSELVELALATAANLIPFGDPGCLNVIKEKPKFESLLALLDHGTPLIKINLCRLLEAGLQRTKESSFMIRNSGDIQRLTLNLINSNDSDDEDNAGVSEAGVKLMLAMCLSCANHSNHQTLVKLAQIGGVRSLVRYIIRSLDRVRGGGGGGLGAATEALEVMLEVEGGKQAVLGEEDCVRALVKMVFRVCDHEGSESAVVSLIGLCCESGEAREEAVRVGVLTQLLLVLQSQCSVRAKAKARMLLKLLRVMWAKAPLGVC